MYWNGGGTGAIISIPIYNTGSASILTYTVSPVTTGTSYLFAVSAYNSVAESTRSPSVTIIAATVPAQPNSVLRSGSALTAIPFTWTAPYNGGNAIIGYKVQSNGGSGSVFT